MSSFELITAPAGFWIFVHPVAEMRANTPAIAHSVGLNCIHVLTLDLCAHCSVRGCHKSGFCSKRRHSIVARVLLLTFNLRFQLHAAAF